MIIFSGLRRPGELFITAAGRELLYCGSTSLGWVLLMKQPCDQTEIMLEEACIIRPAFNYSDIWAAAAALPSSSIVRPQNSTQQHSSPSLSRGEWIISKWEREREGKTRTARSYAGVKGTMGYIHLRTTLEDKIVPAECFQCTRMKMWRKRSTIC